MKINYVTISSPQLGSLRYQLMNPAREMKKLGHECVFSNDPLEGYDAYVFHKHFRYEEQEMIKRVKGKKVFAVCDYHFDSPHRDHYISMIESADIVISATNKLAEYIKEETGKEATVIFDSWGTEFSEQPPKFRPNESIICLWFGHVSNIEALKKSVNKLDGCKLLVVTNSESKKFIPYSIGNMKKAFEMADIVIIPQDVTDPRRISKTHNRMVDSFRQGKFVIASPVDSYLDFRNWAYIGDLKDGIDWLKQQKPEDIEMVIGKAQGFIRETFDPAILAKQWETALGG